MIKAAVEKVRYQEHVAEAIVAAQQTRKWLRDRVMEARTGHCSVLGDEQGNREIDAALAACEPKAQISSVVLGIAMVKLGVKLNIWFKHKAGAVHLGPDDATKEVDCVWAPEHFDCVSYIVPAGEEVVVHDVGQFDGACKELIKGCRMLYQLSQQEAEHKGKSHSSPSGAPKSDSSAPLKTGKAADGGDKGKGKPAGKGKKQGGKKVCRFHKAGVFCKFGDECKFAHPASGDVTLPKGKSVVAKVSLEDRIKKLEGEVGRDALKRSRSPQEPKSRALAPGVCRFYASEQHCKYGDVCKFAHSAASPTDVGRVAVKRVRWSDAEQSDGPQARMQPVLPARVGGYGGVYRPGLQRQAVYDGMYQPIFHSQPVYAHSPAGQWGVPPMMQLG
jgi:hypothetical protein